MIVRFSIVQQYSCERISEVSWMNDCFFQSFIPETSDFERKTTIIEGLNDFFRVEITYIV